MPRTHSHVAVLVLAILVACKPGGSPSGAAADGAKRSSDPSLTSLEAEEVMQVYYQFVDEGGRVRFVPTLDAVPEQWRDRVGFVEMSSPPPMSPGDAARIRQAKLSRMPGRSSGGSAGGPDAARRGDAEIILYSADWCGACRSAKQYMDAQGIDYVERNVDEDRWKQEMFAKAGQGGIPVFDINGQILRGFSPQRLSDLIGRAS